MEYTINRDFYNVIHKFSQKDRTQQNKNFVAFAVNICYIIVIKQSGGPIKCSGIQSVLRFSEIF